MTGKTDAPRFIHLTAGRFPDVMQQNPQASSKDTGEPSLPSASSIISVWVYTSPSGCHWGGCVQPIISYISGMTCFINPVSTSISTPRFLPGDNKILSSSSRMRSGEIRASSGAFLKWRSKSPSPPELPW